MQLVNRTTCLRCELNGVETALIKSKRGGICPLHEPEWLDPPPRVVRDPYLVDKGVPGWAYGFRRNRDQD
jgi:hypothetical protein